MLLTVFFVATRYSGWYSLLYMTLQPKTLCLDVGFANTGWALWNGHRFIDAGCIVTSKSEDKISVMQDNMIRCRLLFRRLATIMERSKATRIIAEYPFGGSRNMKAATAMSMASAIVTCLVEHSGVELIPITPNQVKRVVNPKARAAVSKEQVIAYVIRRYGEDLLPPNAVREHIADAMACMAVYQQL